MGSYHSKEKKFGRPLLPGHFGHPIRRSNKKLRGVGGVDKTFWATEQGWPADPPPKKKRTGQGLKPK